jgi:uncharacterized protein (TIGR00730 family)
MSESRRVCVYCASSQGIDPRYHAEARRVGELLATAGYTLVYGGGSAGSMGQVADGALSAGGTVVGIIPKFMQDLEWGHKGVTQLDVVEDMRERKHRMLVDTDAVISLPGGCGTFEELFEALTLKRLGHYRGPIILLNTLNYYEHCNAMLNQAVDQRFMTEHNREMWTVVDTPESAVEAVAAIEPWPEGAISHAVVRQ